MNFTPYHADLASRVAVVSQSENPARREAPVLRPRRSNHSGGWGGRSPLSTQKGFLNDDHPLGPFQKRQKIILIIAEDTSINIRTG